MARLTGETHESAWYGIRENPILLVLGNWSFITGRQGAAWFRRWTYYRCHRGRPGWLGGGVAQPWRFVGSVEAIVFTVADQFTRYAAPSAALERIPGTFHVAAQIHGLVKASAITAVILPIAQNTFVDANSGRTLDLVFLAITLEQAIVLTQVVRVVATHPGLVRVIGTLLDPVAGCRSNDTGSVGALKVRLGAVMRLGNAQICGFVGSIRTVFDAIAALIQGDTAPIIALNLKDSAFGQCF